MECPDLERLLPAFCDGELIESERSEFDTHLETCPHCREEVESQLQFKLLVREKVAASPRCAPDTLRARIRRDISVERATEQARRFGAYVGVAAGLVAVASAGYVVAGRGQRPYPGGVVSDAIDKHARALPVEVTPAGGDIDSWFQGKVDFNVHVPRFRSQNGPRLVGARLANVRDRQAAYVVYDGATPRGEGPSRRMTLLVFPGEELPDGRKAQVQGRDVVLANERGYNVALWRKRGVVYSLVSDLDEGDVLQLVSEVEER